MIKETATVAAINHQDITVVSELKSACSGCQQVEQCGSGQVANAFPTKKLSLTLKSELSLNIGDKVVLGLNESALLSSAWQVYFLPLLGLILAAWLGQWLVITALIPELIAITIAGLGAVLGFYLAKYLQAKKQAEIEPKILYKAINVEISD